MGHTEYSCLSRSVRAGSMGYETKTAGQIFTQRQINNAMNPSGIVVRESRDSKEHPESLAIIIALDETGSMGTVPHFLVKKGLPDIMQSIIDGGIKDPQVLFLGIGDHEFDESPLQVGQFESGDEELDKWLTDLYLEGNGGGNAGESYLLAWYFAAKHTAIDCFEKRKTRGFLFTIGDEPTLKEISKSSLKDIMGDGQYGNATAAELLAEAGKTFNVYHIHIAETSAGKRRETTDGWKQLLSDHCIVAERKEDVAKIIASTVLSGVEKPSQKTEILL